MPLNINIKKLVRSPFLQDNIIDPDTREPAIGEVHYYKAGCDGCPKNIYIETGDPQNPYEAAPNPITLDSSGSIPYGYTFAYPFDENDESTQELYDVVVKRLSDNTEILRRNNWPPIIDAEKPDSGAISNLNICPNYEFHSIVDADLYATKPVKKAFQTMAWGWYWFLEDSSKYDLSYRATLLNQGSPPDIEETPLNEMVIRFTNSQGNSGYRHLGFYLGTYNAFQGKFIALSHYLANINATPSLNVFLVRYNKGLGTIDSPINLGTLTIPSSSLTKVELTVKIPDITETGYISEDRAYIALSPPENIDCEFSITANWCQVVSSETSTASPSRLPMGLSRAQAFFNEFDLNMATNGRVRDSFEDNSNNLFQSDDGLALTVSDGERDAILKTGSIQQVLTISADRINDSVPITESNEVPLFRDEKYTGNSVLPKLCRNNRLIYELYHSNANNEHALLTARKAPDSVEVSLINGNFSSPWSTNNTTAITLTTSGSGLPYGVIPTKISPSTLRLQYPTVWNPAPVEPIYPAGVQNQDFYGPGGYMGLPIQPSPNIGNWFEVNFVRVSEPVVLPYGSDILQSTYVPPSGGLGQGVDLEFTVNTPELYGPKSLTYESELTVSRNLFYINKFYDFIEIPSISLPTLRGIPYASSRDNSGQQFIYRNPAITLYWRTLSVPKIIRGQQSTLEIDVRGLSTVEQLIDKTVVSMSGKSEYTIKYNQIPNNGDWIKFSNDIDVFSAQFIKQGEPTPIPPSGVTRNFLIDIYDNDTTSTLAARTLEVFPLFFRYIPSLSQLEISPTSFSTYVLNL